MDENKNFDFMLNIGHEIAWHVFRGLSRVKPSIMTRIADCLNRCLSVFDF
jgi:hypothetical protein